jgi:hypothetical protein
MSDTETKTVKSKVEQVDVNLDEIFNVAPTGADIIQDDSTPKNIFSGINKKSDMKFLDPDSDDADDITAKVDDNVEEPEVQEDVKVEEPKVETKESSKEGEDIIESLDIDNELEEVTETKSKRGRKPISGISDVFDKLIKDEKIVPFDDDKSLEEYSAKDWEELIEANLEEKANQVRQNTKAIFSKSSSRTSNSC